MVKQTKAMTKVTVTGKENKDEFVLIRDIRNDSHHVVPKNEIITAKKFDKLQPGDEISHGQRGKRLRALILTIGSENDCKHAMSIIERGNSFKSNEKHKKKHIEKQNCVKTTTDVNIYEDDDNDDVASFENSSEKDFDYDEENESDSDDHIPVNEKCILKNNYSCNNVEQASSFVSKDIRTSFGGMKRKSSLDKDNIEEKNKKARYLNGNSVPSNVQAALQRRIDTLEAQLLEYQTTWMPRPSDQATITYLIDIGKILSGEAEMDSDAKGELLYGIMESLEMTEKELEDCKGKNIRITVRQIMKSKYSSTPLGFKFADVDRKHVKAAREYGRLTHPTEERRYTDGDLNHAMGNVFAAQKHRTALLQKNN